jgi:hypothetical protein
MLKVEYIKLLPAKYKAGNYIRIKYINSNIFAEQGIYDLGPKEDVYTSGFWFTEPMAEKYGGKISKIKKVFWLPSELDNNIYVPIYILEIDGGEYYWEDFMIEEIIGGKDDTIIQFNEFYIICDREKNECLMTLFKSEIEALQYLESRK